MRMRWVHCAAVGKPTILRLAVKYQLHPLPVEDVIQLQMQGVPLVRNYGSNYFIIIPLIRLTRFSQDVLEQHWSSKAPSTSTGSPQSWRSHLHRHASQLDYNMDPDAEEACTVEVEQGRLALFVSGPPNSDTVISVQTKWVLHRSEDSRTTSSSSTSAPSGIGRRCFQRGNQVTPSAGPNEEEFGEMVLGASTCADGSRRNSFRTSQADIDLESPALGEEKDAGTDAFDTVAREIMKDFSVLRSGNASWLLWRLVDLVVDDMAPILSAFRARLQWFAAHIAKYRARAHGDTEKKLMWTRVEMDWLQRKARPMVRLVKHLIHDKSIDEDVTRYLEDVEDHLENFIEEISRSMGVCESLRDQVRSFRDREQQGVLYVLALVTTMTTPVQMLTGMYGMNWIDDEGKPVVPGFGRLDRDRGYVLFWGLGLTIILSIFFTYRVLLKWL
eukprot:TRINITY_DN58282_c0_g1_i1.p1 TRINITY_DN58282_c0_g1~~TRINITY_DN58282_c0_g1_i1.p1  ORF type:complete len:443 (+),score=62.13 TRINITY_DN58282_c0_g1_i1:45-1373(+)